MMQLIISFNPQTTRLEVTGPVQDKMLCYAMLERAKDVVRAYEPPRVIPAAPGDVPPQTGDGLVKPN